LVLFFLILLTSRLILPSSAFLASSSFTISSTVSQTYYTSSLTSKIGSMWSISPSFSTTRLVIELPANITVAGLSQIPAMITQEKGSLVFEFATGNVELRYYVKRIVPRQPHQLWGKKLGPQMQKKHSSHPRNPPQAWESTPQIRVPR